ncbi:hypothetical protein BIY24_03745 [Halobacteriovorax marinus]|uniref:hypothetical protein n=1 Tax=Halobacteriovorax marinus TaxID=97084 RepID=UPI000BC2F29D|nr:hypothetical protein [Halobacteriovorax marinus]ATH07079.1 hypothetical protein BIY24_03745 [Halobacteriovorax marinus]
MDLTKTRDIFKNWVVKSLDIDQDLFICSPFFTKGGYELLEKLKPGRLFIRGRKRDIQSGSLCLSSIKTLIQKGWEVRTYSSLHAKVYYSFYSNCSLIGSANMSFSGFPVNENGNLEILYCLENYRPEEVLVKFYESKILSLECIESEKIESKGSNTNIALDSNFSLLELVQSESLSELKRNLEQRNFNNIVMHDIELLGISVNASLGEIKSSFLKTDLISQFLDFLEDGKKFGVLKKWLMKNVTDEPTPSRREYSSQLRKVYDLVVEASTIYEIAVLQKHSEWLINTKIDREALVNR